jgi:hypothetical protein
MQNAATERETALGKKGPQSFDPDEPIGDLLGQIIADGRDLAEAELALVKAKAISEAAAYRRPAFLLGIAAIFAIGAVITLFWAIAASLATLVGPLAGGVIASAIAIVIALLCAAAAKKQMGRLK